MDLGHTKMTPCFGHDISTEDFRTTPFGHFMKEVRETSPEYYGVLGQANWSFQMPVPNRFIDVLGPT